MDLTSTQHPARKLVDGRPNGSLSLFEVEAQLGEALTVNEPILSQLHVLMQPVHEDDDWEMNESSMVPINL